MELDQVGTEFVSLCGLVLAKCPDQYAQAYAQAGLDLAAGITPFDFNVHTVKAQIPYLQSNIGGWRGEDARIAREGLKSILACIQDEPDHIRLSVG